MHHLIKKFPNFVDYCTAPFTANENRKMTLVENIPENRLEYKLALKEGNKILGYLIFGIEIQDGLTIFVLATSKGKTSKGIATSIPLLNMLEPLTLDYDSTFDRLLAALFKSDSFKNLEIA